MIRMPNGIGPGRFAAMNQIEAPAINPVPLCAKVIRLLGIAFTTR